MQLNFNTLDNGTELNYSGKFDETPHRWDGDMVDRLKHRVAIQKELYNLKK